RGQQGPDHAAAEAEADGGQLLVGGPALQLVQAGPHVGHQPPRRGGAGGGPQGRGLVAHGGGPALGRQQVDGQGRVAAGGQAAGDRADVVGEAAVLVDDQHGPAPPGCGGGGG